MYKIINRFNKYSKFIPLFIYLITLYLSKEICLLMFNVIDSPDFYKYFEYIRYFFYESEQTNLSQGNFYYILQSWGLYFFSHSISENNAAMIINNSVQAVNFFLYIIAQIGLYNLLRFFQIERNTILLTLSLLNFFPLMIALRITMKSEILVLAFLPWIILLIEIFLKTKKSTYLFIAVPMLALVILSKGVAFGAISIFLLLIYIKKLIFINKKLLLFLTIFFISLSSLLLIEDSNINNQNLLEPTHEDKYNNLAPISTIYKIEIKDFVNTPFKHNQSNSFIGITLLDTFGDYFDLYWNNDSSNFFKNRKQLIIYESDNSKILPTFSMQDKIFTVYGSKSDSSYANSGDYLRDTLSWVLALLFYFLILKISLEKNKIRKFFIGPFIGMSLLLITSITGFPVKNYDVNISDTLKPFYYSYFVILSFAFVCVYFFKKNFFTKLFFFPLILSFLFILGFPKASNEEFENKVSLTNSYSTFCEVNNIYFKIMDYEVTDCSSSPNIRNMQLINSEDYLSIKPKIAYTNLFFGFTTILTLGYYFYDRKKILNE